MADVIQIRDHQPRDRGAPKTAAKVISLGERARKLREQFNKAKPVVVK